MLHDISMREVRLQYDGATLMNTQIKEQITRITRMTLLGTVYRDFQNSCIHQMVDIEMAKGVDLEEINEIPF